MYESPINIIYGQMQTQMEGDIFRAVQSYGINVDKEELLRALQYDREQYRKGYADGTNDAMASIVRCKDCKWWKGEYCTNRNGACCLVMNGNWFCCSGERKDNGC